MAKELLPGDQAPPIVLPDQDGKTRKLAEHRGKWVLVYFYPRDDTPGCTVEACAFRDAASQYAEAGVEVLGISADSAKSHRKFANKYRLPFPLLADEEMKVIKAFGSWGKKKFMGREFDGILRTSVLIDPKGRVAKVYPKLKPDLHAEEVLVDVVTLAGRARSAQVVEPKASPKKKAPAAQERVAKKPASTKKGSTKKSVVKKPVLAKKAGAGSASRPPAKRKSAARKPAARKTKAKR